MRQLVVIALALLLAACGSAPAASVTAQSVIDQFKAAGLSAENIRPRERVADSPLPNSYQENLQFDIPALGTDKGGQVFTCDTKQNCDALYAYFDALKGLAGPYLYQSSSGTVVVQMNSGLTPDEAAKYQAVVAALP